MVNSKNIQTKMITIKNTNKQEIRKIFVRN